MKNRDVGKINFIIGIRLVVFINFSSYNWLIEWWGILLSILLMEVHNYNLALK